MSQSKGFKVKGVDPITGASVTYTIGPDGIPKGFFDYVPNSDSIDRMARIRFKRMPNSSVGSEIFDIGYKPPGWTRTQTRRDTWFKRFIPGSRSGKTSLAFRRVTSGIIRPRYRTRQFGGYKDFKAGMKGASSMNARMEKMIALRQTMLKKGFDINRSGTAFVRVKNVRLVSGVKKPTKVMLGTTSRSFGSGKIGSRAFKSVIGRADYIGKIAKTMRSKGFALDSIGTSFKRVRNISSGISGSRMKWLQTKSKLNNAYINSVLKNKVAGKTSNILGTIKVYGMKTESRIKTKVFSVRSKTGGYVKKISGAGLEGKKLKEIITGSNILSGWAVPRVSYGLININMHNYDEVSYKLIEYQVWIANIHPQQFASALRKSIPAQIKKKYKNRNQGQWPINAPNWRRTKAYSGYDKRVMHQHDTRPDDHPYGQPLALSVEKSDSHIHVNVVGGAVVVSGLDEAFKFNPYVWFHEIGFSTRGVRVPARPFIAPGVQEGVAQAMRWVMDRNPSTSTNYGVYWNSNNVSSYVNAQRNIMGRLGRWIWWFMPPSEYWKYLGIYADIMATLKGYLLNPSTLVKFLSAFGLGKLGGMVGVPLTKKSRRRRFRHKLWS